jgi:hypothetical protein
MDPTQNTALVIFAAVLPVLIALIKQSRFTAQANALIAFVIYVVVGLAGAFIATGGLPTAETAVDFIATVTVVGSVAYKLFWSNMGVTSDGAPSLEQRIQDSTSIGG